MERKTLTERLLPAALFAVTMVFSSTAAAQTSDLPQGVVDLPVPGFNSATFVAPDGSTPAPWPLTVVLHGNYDRPEWECDIWSKVARPRGWLLCPRGYPRKDAPPAADRWTYAGRGKLAQEIEAGVSALDQRFPGKVTRDDAWLIGFSLGANMTPRLLSMKILPFTSVVLGEGGFGVTVPLAQTAAARGVRRVVYLCGERTICPQRSRAMAKVWRRGRVPGVKTVIMPGVGHGYANPFDDLGLQVFELLQQ